MKYGPQYMLAAVLLSAAFLSCCSTQGRLSVLKRQPPVTKIAVGENTVSDTCVIPKAPAADTLIIKNIDGRDMILMKAVRDEDGQMVASQVLNAAKVTARFRNVAERHGKVDLCFQVTVPSSLLDSRWQLRYSPLMMALGDTLSLDKIIITGKEYRRRQLRGYQQYQRFLDRIISDTTAFINIKELEIFIRRNIPRLYAFRNDSTFVSDEQFNSVFGVTQREAIEHYTDHLALRRNRRRISNKDRMFRKYVKSPILTRGIRLDTVIMNNDGDYTYNYVQTIRTRPGLRKVDVTVSGGIYEQDKFLCGIAPGDTLNFYISSLSAFVDDSERYVTRIIERRAEANMTHNIAFASGKADISVGLGDNRQELRSIKSNLLKLMCNEEFDLDSVTVTATASPEGSWKANKALSSRRGNTVAAYFERYMNNCLDSLGRQAVAEINLDEGYSGAKHSPAKIKFSIGYLPENWNTLDILVERDSLLSDREKEEYRSIRKIEDPDRREKDMTGRSWYRHLRKDLYPALRTVSFDFHLHRKGMIKDTVHTTVLDSVYMAGIQAVKDRDYETAVMLLMPYGDYNTAVAYCALDRNANAMNILQGCEKTARVNYMLALLYSRAGDDGQAVSHYLISCSQNPQYVHRGNLDPEISRLIKTYDLNRQLTQYQNNEL